MESELDLHEHLKDMQVLGSAPELFSTFVRAGVIPTLLQLLSHGIIDPVESSRKNFQKRPPKTHFSFHFIPENVDIAVDVVALFHEMLDLDTLEENPDAVNILVDTLVNNQSINT